jgi:glycosyltransferase involved in cell wall biosynthesis
MVPAPVRCAVSASVRRSRIVARSARLRLLPAYADTAYWEANEHFSRIYELARLHRVDIWLANDWTTLPIAARLADEQGIPFAYDTHELAVDEYAQNLKWRLLHRPLIRHAEGASIRRAAFVSCVSDGIADRLGQVHSLSRRPIVIRNTPHYQSHALRPTGDMIKVLYHGIVAPGRGLEACIRSVKLWRREFSLTVRGPAPPSYLESLQAIAREAGVAGRVTFDPPVPMTELVARATEFDVGLFALPNYSRQNVYVLPNKFFEYTMAGLALVVSDLPEMTRLLRQHDLGRLIGGLTPQSIAEAINSLDRSAIQRYKANALEAAKMLNWQVEGIKFAELSAAAIARSRKVCSPD